MAVNDVEIARAFQCPRNVNPFAQAPILRGAVFAVSPWQGLAKTARYVAAGRAESRDLVAECCEFSCENPRKLFHTATVVPANRRIHGGDLCNSHSQLSFAERAKMRVCSRLQVDFILGFLINRYDPIHYGLF